MRPCRALTAFRESKTKKEADIDLARRHSTSAAAWQPLALCEERGRSSARFGDDGTRRAGRSVGATGFCRANDAHVKTSILTVGRGCYNIKH